jgi:hypothetical protein
MSLLGERSLTRRRIAAQTWDDGVATPGASADTPFLGSLQPMSGDDRQVLLEGLRSKRGRKVYAPRNTLRTEDQHGGVPADQVVDGTTVYTVIHVDNDHPLLEHDRAYLVRVQEVA